MKLATGVAYVQIKSGLISFSGNVHDARSVDVLCAPFDTYHAQKALVRWLVVRKTPKGLILPFACCAVPSFLQILSLDALPIVVQQNKYHRRIC
jgi:hypothetical protein